MLYVKSGGVLSGTAGSSAASDTVQSAGGANRDGSPTNAQVYTITGLNGTYQSGGTTNFNLYVDAGTGVGNGVQVQIVYDFHGDGTLVKTETYNYFATDPVTGWELYNQTRNISPSFSSGSFTNMVNGKITVKVWNAIGNSSTTVLVNAPSNAAQVSKFTVPFQ
uniref:Uncharacterized protein n=1 Tax=Paenibacillus athensensis TaxID=1967502 RepID=A0A4Y8Q1N3_9BACL